MIAAPETLPLDALHAQFGRRVEFNARLASHTAARIGGEADALLTVTSAEELAEAAVFLWNAHLPFLVLGGGSNMLVSDAGVRGVVVLNKARAFHFDGEGVWAESGANFGALARQAASRSLTGLEWAGGVPGTVGGAVVGNAGAHDGNMAGNLVWADVLLRGGERERWPAARLGYAYRSSIFKQEPGLALVLAAQLKLEPGSPKLIGEKTEHFLAHRKRTQPPGASMGSMFKNPESDYAGRLIDAAGLKGLQVGAAGISPLHANFFINHGGASAKDVFELIERARAEVAQQFDVTLELEVELAGEWPPA